MSEEQYIVVCRADRAGRRKGPYVLATRQVFASQADAERYAATLNNSRQPIVVAGRWGQLREPERPAVVAAVEDGWRWEVIVGNVGTVYDGGSYHDALSAFYAYVENSKANVGRAAGEPVTLMRDGEINREYAGTLAAAEDDSD